MTIIDDNHGSPASSPTLTGQSRNCSTFGISIAVVALFALAVLVASFVISRTDLPQVQAPDSSHSQVVTARPPTASTPWSPVSHLPDVLIFRRSFKTGSTSMVAALVREMPRLSYIPLHETREHVAKIILRGNDHVQQPKRYLILHHNGLSRNVSATGKRVMILDTVRDGFEQVTGHCRYIENVENCDASLVRCMRNETIRHYVNTYRWAGAQEEDESTFIDLPLVSEYPALSTTVFRRVFPNVTLALGHYRALNKSCPRLPSLVAAYNENYQPLERQILMLRHRMLVLAGYPIHRHENVRNQPWEAILEAADDLERPKYSELSEHVKRSRSVSSEVMGLRTGLLKWALGNGGKVVLQHREWSEQLDQK